MNARIKEGADKTHSATERTIAKYLRRYAEPEIVSAEAIDTTYDAALVIPICGEEVSCLQGIEAACASFSGRVACIVVVNGKTSSPGNQHDANERFGARLKRAQTMKPLDDSSAVWWGRGATDFVLIDRYSVSRRFPPSSGVGLARKIGCDFALALASQGSLLSRWIHTTDADVTLPPDYFSRTISAHELASPGAASSHTLPRASAFVYPFWHVTTPPFERAGALYDLSLRYYVMGLRRARSPYAFHTLGSTFAIDTLAYARVRGVPNRLAGEDFYLLSKLRKTGSVFQSSGAPIQIEARASTRVPFGTGPGIARIAEKLVAGETPTFYHPASFSLLAQLLSSLEELGSGNAVYLRAPASFDSSQREIYERALHQIAIQRALDDAATNTRSAHALRRRVRDWFDGFRTLKFVHALRDAGLNPVPWRDALRAIGVELENESQSELEAARTSMARADGCRLPEPGSETPGTLTPSPQKTL